MQYTECINGPTDHSPVQTRTPSSASAQHRVVIYCGLFMRLRIKRPRQKQPLLPALSAGFFESDTIPPLDITLSMGSLCFARGPSSRD